MSNEPLSQAEIDALFGSLPAADTGSSGAAAPAAPATSPDEQKLAQALDTALGEGLGALTVLLSQPTSHAALELYNATAEHALTRLEGKRALVATAPFVSGLNGAMYWVLAEDAAGHVLRHLFGADEVPPVDEMGLGALSEVVGQLAGSALTKLSALSGRTLVNAPITMKWADSNQMGDLSYSTASLVAMLTVTVGSASFPLGLVLPKPVADELSQALSAGGKPAAAPAPAPAPAASAGVAMAQAAATVAPLPSAGAPAMVPQVPVNLQPVQFREMGSAPASQPVRNIDLLMDVNLQVTVELGRTRRQIRDVLALGKGSVIELDRLAGEAVDVLVNGKLIAKGEVVVIDESFGVRVTDIVSPTERVNSLK